MHGEASGESVFKTVAIPAILSPARRIARMAANGAGALPCDNIARL
jgi:hypothetical protein